MRADVRVAIRVAGVVQGVGFRPFVYTLARRLALSGHVGNDSAGVFVEVEGSRRAVEEFLAGLRRESPPLADIESVDVVEVPPLGASGFCIVPSPAPAGADTLIAADSATCADCLRELTDPGDRRYRYPFVNCTHCGPRFTIVRGVPYDRPLTTMAGFALCPRCAAEYDDPADRRFHAQPVCCPECGPTLRLEAAETVSQADPIASAVALLRRGAVLAVKGLGGYHLAADATSEGATRTLRERKHRADKPFAVMVADLRAARNLCTVDDASASLLSSRARPIVLVPKRAGIPVAEPVAPGNRSVGLMLPYTPLHHLLLADFGGPLVMTSGNVSDEPIAYRDDDARERLSGIADAFLTHDRPIHIRTDDSVARTFRGKAQLQRRSRGYVPDAVGVHRAFPRPVLACGAELKNTFCLGKATHAFLSHHIGDLENYETLRSFTDGIAHFRRLFAVEPQVVAHDLHPEYLSTKYAQDLPDVELVGVQHHHAHIASCLADNGEDGPVVGVAFDGTGYGCDGTLWGGEFLLADLASFTRRAHLAPMPMPGGVAAIRSPWRMAAAYLDAAFEGVPPGGLDVARRNADDWAAVVALARSGVNAPMTTSAGRLFDAVAAVLGVRDRITYEGQAAIELEQWADPAESGSYPAVFTDGDPIVIDGPGVVRACVADLRAGAAPGIVAARFHHTLATIIERVCRVLAERTGIGTVALSGGVFQNLLLLEAAVGRLEDAGLRVLTHSRVPTNDGGVSLGQAVVAAARIAPA